MYDQRKPRVNYPENYEHNEEETILKLTTIWPQLFAYIKDIVFHFFHFLCCQIFQFRITFYIAIFDIFLVLPSGILSTLILPEIEGRVGTSAISRWLLKAVSFPYGYAVNQLHWFIRFLRAKRYPSTSARLSDHFVLHFHPITRDSSIFACHSGCSSRLFLASGLTFDLTGMRGPTSS
uniref:Uncharacterized protein n=1 Tax=Glossina pallidipes TaxID=7398 RepID=A0A1B0A744_GLOPL